MKYLFTLVAAAMLVGAVASADDAAPTEKPVKPHHMNHMNHKMKKADKEGAMKKGDKDAAKPADEAAPGGAPAAGH